MRTCRDSIEEPEVLADRMERIHEGKRRDSRLHRSQKSSALVGVFEYFIGNTDFSISALHNIALLAQPDGNVIPVPYDFDFSALANARYATPDPKLAIDRVRDRLFRGYCAPAEEYSHICSISLREKRRHLWAVSG